MRSETTDRTLRYLRTLRNWLHPTFQAEFIAVIDAEIDFILALDTARAVMDAAALEIESAEWRDEQATRESVRPL